MKAGSLLSRITAAGVGAGLLSMLLWPLEARFSALFWPQVALVAIVATSGAAVLVLTAADLLVRRRGRRVAPIRVFDVACGLALLGLAYLQLDWLRGQLPA